MNRKTIGFTLIELMVAVAILGILLALVAPSFVNLVRDYQRSSAVNDLLADMLFARSEAAQRGRVVTVCSHVSGDSCGTDAQWDAGWLIFEDEDADGVRDANDEILRRASGRGATLDVSGNKAAFRFRPFNRRLLVDAGNVVFCDPRDAGRASARYSRAIVVAQGGRARVDEAPGTVAACT